MITCFLLCLFKKKSTHPYCIEKSQGAKPDAAPAQALVIPRMTRFQSGQRFEAEGQPWVAGGNEQAPSPGHSPGRAERPHPLQVLGWEECRTDSRKLVWAKSRENQEDQVKI